MLASAEQNRAFGYAVAASIALHALVLSLHAPFRHTAAPPPPPPPIIAHLEEPAPPAPRVVEETAPAPTPAAKPRLKPKPKTKPKPKPKLAVEEGMSQGEMARPPAAPPPEVSETPPAVLPAPTPPPSVAARSASVAPSVAAPRPDPLAALARFRQQLVDYAVRYKRYPRMAVDRGWTGDVVVRIEVSASGAVSSVKVKTSSGYDVLDEQALEMFRRAAPEVAVPEALRGKAFSIEVRAIYNLRERPG